MAHTYVYCPYCGKLLGSYFGAGKGYLPIGPPTVPCPYCDKPIKTDETEWVEKSILAKIGFFIHVFFALIGAALYWGVGFGIVASGIDYFYIQQGDTLPVITAIVGSVVGVTLAINNVITAIRTSLKRTLSNVVHNSNNT